MYKLVFFLLNAILSNYVFTGRIEKRQSGFSFGLGGPYKSFEGYLDEVCLIVKTIHNFWIKFKWGKLVLQWFGLGLWCLTPLSTIFQLYCGGQSYWWRKLEYPEKTTDLHAASHWQTWSHNGVSSTPHPSGIWTHNVSGDRHWLHRYFSEVVLNRPYKVLTIMWSFWGNLQF